jgi:hypothetical protein
MGLVSIFILSKLAKTPRKKYMRYVSLTEPSTRSRVPETDQLGCHCYFVLWYSKCSRDPIAWQRCLREREPGTDTNLSATPECYTSSSISIVGRVCTPLLHEETSCHSMLLLRHLYWASQLLGWASFTLRIATTCCTSTTRMSIPRVASMLAYWIAYRKRLPWRALPLGLVRHRHR